MGQCIPLHHISGAAGCGCGATHGPTEADALNRASGIIGFVCIRGGPPVRDRAPCSRCGRDCAVRPDGTIWGHEPRNPPAGHQPGRVCAGAGQPPAIPPATLPIEVL
jgi:hypothetical protein